MIVGSKGEPGVPGPVGRDGLPGRPGATGPLGAKVIITVQSRFISVCIFISTLESFRNGFRKLFLFS